MFRLLLENIEPCTKSDPKQTNGFLTNQANGELQTLLYPLEKLIWHSNEWTGVQAEFGANREPLDADMEVTVLRDLPHVKRIELKSRLDKADKQKNGASLGLVVHRTNLLKCNSDAHFSGTVSNLDNKNFVFFKLKLSFIYFTPRSTSTDCWESHQVNRSILRF